MLCVGDTLIEPASGCAPKPLSIDTDVAFCVVHVSVELCPVTIDDGIAVNVTAGAGTTVTVAVFVIVPPDPVAVNVYVVVDVGLTFTLPEVGFDPMPLSIDTDVAFVVVHVSVDVAPDATLVGAAENVAVGAGKPTVIVTWAVR